MKKLIFPLIIVGAISFSCSEEDKLEVIQELTFQEQEDLLFLREEEKLARDVYLYAHDAYGDQIFNNISESEQKHMDKLLELINHYGLTDPASPHRGVFNNSDLQDLYNSLTATCDKSVLSAFIVGATIEDLDISDIVKYESRTDKADVLDVYDNLKCGSTNHLRKYYSTILDNNGTYNPQFISQSYFDEIIAADQQKCGNE